MRIYNQAIGVLGIWLIITSLFTGSLPFMIWSNTIVGLIVSIAAFAMLERQRWGGIFGLIVGIWLLHSFYFMEGDNTTIFVINNIVSGLILVADGYFSQGTETRATM